MHRNKTALGIFKCLLTWLAKLRLVTRYACAGIEVVVGWCQDCPDHTSLAAGVPLSTGKQAESLLRDFLTVEATRGHHPPVLRSITLSTSHHLVNKRARVMGHG